MLNRKSRFVYLQRANRIDDTVRINRILSVERQLNDNTINGGIGVQFGDLSYESILSDVTIELDMSRVDADLLSAL